MIDFPKKVYKPLVYTTATFFLMANAKLTWAQDGFSSLTDTGDAVGAALSGSTGTASSVITVNHFTCVDRVYIDVDSHFASFNGLKSLVTDKKI